MKHDDDEYEETKYEKYGDRRRKREPVLMLHGRTWSSVLVYHLLGGKSEGAGSSIRSRKEEEKDDVKEEEEGRRNEKNCHKERTEIDDDEDGRPNPGV